MQAQAPKVPETAKQGPEAQDRKWAWVEASVWTERMLAALGNGVKGGRWFSLIDRVYRPTTLAAAWERADHQRWPNAFFAEHGLFTLTAAHALARQSR
jgi:RNA-directed DNA polymerase